MRVIEDDRICLTRVKKGEESERKGVSERSEKINPLSDAAHQKKSL